MILSQSSVRELREQSEKQFVRLVLHDVSNTGQYRLRGRKHDYVFIYDQTAGRHILDIPLSLWQKGAESASSNASWRDNTSIAEDVRAHTNARLSFYVLNYDDAVNAEIAEPKQSNLLTRLQSLFEVYGAPQDVIDLCLLEESDATEEEKDTFVYNVLEREANAEPEDDSPEIPEEPALPAEVTPPVPEQETLPKPAAKRRKPNPTANETESP